jgi:hypothetical protein
MGQHWFPPRRLGANRERWSTLCSGPHAQRVGICDQGRATAAAQFRLAKGIWQSHNKDSASFFAKPSEIAVDDRERCQARIGDHPGMGRHTPNRKSASIPLPSIYSLGVFTLVDGTSFCRKGRPLQDIGMGIQLC